MANQDQASETTAGEDCGCGLGDRCPVGPKSDTTVRDAAMRTARANYVTEHYQSKSVQEIKMEKNNTTGPWGLSIEELCRLCDVSPALAERAIENLKRRGLIEEVEDQHEPE